MAEHAHAVAFRGSVDFALVAAADSSPARREAAARCLPNVRLYDSFEALLADDSGLDFVVLCTPPHVHAAQTIMALEKGLHVLCEKPLALDTEELEQIERTAASSSRCAYTVHNWAFSPQWLKVQELLASGALGEARHAELHVLRSQPAASAVPGDWRKDPKLAGGGILVDHGWHNLYLARRLVSGEPSQMHHVLHRAPSGVDDEATVLLTFPKSTVLLHLTWRSPLRANTAVIYGSEGVLRLNDDTLVLQPRLGPAQSWTFESPLNRGSSHPAWNAAMLEDFRAELDGKHRGRNLAEARFAAETIAKAYRPAPEPALR